MDQSILQRLEQFFQSCCDGEWEHARGISIQSCDNPGWWVKIDLTGTCLSGRPFSEIAEGVSADRKEHAKHWINCYVENGVFNGAGDPSELEQILEIFLGWTDSERVKAG